MDSTDTKQLRDQSAEINQHANALEKQIADLKAEIENIYNYDKNANWEPQARLVYDSLTCRALAARMLRSAQIIEASNDLPPAANDYMDVQSSSFLTMILERGARLMKRIEQLEEESVHVRSLTDEEVVRYCQAARAAAGLGVKK